MKTKFELSVTISPEEQEILQKAEGILQEICFTFDENNQCKLCPMRSVCNKVLNNIATPDNILYHIRNALKVEE